MSDHNESASDSEGNMDIGDNTEECLSEDSNQSEPVNKNVGNFAWADAMGKVLKTSVKKNFILNKAKKDTEIKEKRKSEIEIVDETGNVIKAKKTDSTQPRSFKETMEKQKLKAAWELMGRVKPDIINKDNDRELVRIATRGVVHLFNTVKVHQKKAKNSKEKSTKRKENLGAVKGNFMDILKGHSKRDQMSEADPVMKKANQEETWNILKDDFMMGAEMKDWDKDSDNDQ